MMGVWMGSFAAGNFVASQMKAISLRLADTLGTEVQVFWLIAIQSGIIALILIILSPWLKRMMHGIK
jgi:POT family proton-dependent oligopeptide transporter